jgi:hypothetical protein
MVANVHWHYTLPVVDRDQCGTQVNQWHLDDHEEGKPAEG